jgi:hypothetical protein
MADNIQYKIAVPEPHEKDGEEKNAWTTVGRAFANDCGNITLDLPQHVAVSGRVVLFPKGDFHILFGLE